jgi:glycosyltransferase involved in cell wall biosynthesis
MSKKIKIIFLVNSLGLGGAEAVVLNLAKNIDKSKFEITVAYFSKSNKKLRDHNFVETNNFRDVKFHLIMADRLLSWLVFFDLLYYFKQNKPDIVHCHLPVSAILGVVAAKIAGVKKIIVHEHNTHHFYSWKIRLALRFIGPLVDYYICYSESVQQELFGRVNILDSEPNILSYKDYTIRNGVNYEAIVHNFSNIDRLSERQKFGFRQDDLLVISVSRLVEWKGQDVLIKAFAEVIKDFPQAKLLIVGKGEQEFYLKNLSQQLGLEQSIVFLGERTDVFNLLAISDVFSFVLNYPKNFNSETIGISALEAMASGLPVLLADYPARPSFIQQGENAIIVPVGDVKALSGAIIKLLESNDDRQKIAKQAQLAINNYYNWRKIILIYERFYNLL